MLEGFASCTLLRKRRGNGNKEEKGTDAAQKPERWGSQRDDQGESVE